MNRGLTVMLTIAMTFFSGIVVIFQLYTGMDPGFPTGGGAYLRGSANMRFYKVSRKKLHEIETILACTQVGFKF